MIEVNGAVGSATIYTDNADDKTIGQVIELCNQPIAKDSSIKIMPDCHAGAGCVIGTTMRIDGMVIPNIVGVDIGCGMAVACIGKRADINLERLDDFIRQSIPAGQEVFPTERSWDKIDTVFCADSINKNRALCSIGTLGGGNHFIELDKDDEDNIYVVIHSGSRYFGKQIADYYQRVAIKTLREDDIDIRAEVDRLKQAGRNSEIEGVVKRLKQLKPKIPDAMAYVAGTDLDNYIHDMQIAQRYAGANRNAMLDAILKYLGIIAEDAFHTVHNYIDVYSMMVRKGAISARAGERVIIPMNMRDGSLLCTGKGNPDWNYSAPHGAGRIMSRSQAKVSVDMEQYKKSMEGIYTSSVSASTIDESPMAYKPMDEIIGCIGDTVTVDKIVKPIYNFKAGD